MSEWRSTKNPPKASYAEVIVYKKETEEEWGYMEFGIWDGNRWLIKSETGGTEIKDPLPTHWMHKPEPPC